MLEFHMLPSSLVTCEWVRSIPRGAQVSSVASLARLVPWPLSGETLWVQRPHPVRRFIPRRNCPSAYVSPRYWDYTLDAGPNVYKAEIFSTDPEIGFGDGGHVPINELGGRAGGFIVDNGAFANYRVRTVIIACLR